MMRRLLLALVTVPFFVACSQAAQPTDGTERPVTGSVALSAYTLDNPVVLAYAKDGTVQVAPVARDGSFRLRLVSGTTVRLVLASTRRDGRYQVVSDLTWGATKSRWGNVPAGETALSLGTIRPVAGATVATRSGGGSGSGGGGDTESSGSGSGDDKSSGSESESSGDKSGGSDCDDKKSESEKSGDGEDACYAPGKADLPYDVRPQVGQTFRLLDAFLLKGAPPKAVLDVTMDGGSWRLDELKAGSPFVITQADCDHAGNRDVGRDRIFVTWQNADGSKQTDHLDMRYCKGGASERASFPVAAPGAGNAGVSCNPSDVKACGSSAKAESSCYRGGLEPSEGPEDATPACDASGAGAGAADPASGGAGAGGADPAAAGGTGTGAADPAAGSATTPGAVDAPASFGTGGFGDACVVTADCGPTLACFGSVCTTPLR